MKKMVQLSARLFKSFLIGTFLLINFSAVNANRNIKFSVDLSLLVNQGKFNPSTDAVYIKGTFNNWGTGNLLTAEANNIYSVTLSLADYSFNEYKYFITSAGATNSGWENNFPISSGGNRMVGIKSNDLVLPTVYYNDADMTLGKSSLHFNFYYTSADNAIIGDVASQLEKSYDRIVTALQATITSKTDIYIYKDLKMLHMATGNIEAGDGSLGSAFGKSLIAIASPAKVDYVSQVDVLIHEFTHCVEAWKTKVTNYPAWLNEGVACYYGRQISTKDWIKSVTLQYGKPDIATLFNGSFGYAYSYIVAYYIIKTKGEQAMAKFVENMNYADIGYANLAELQTDWHKFLDSYLDYQTTVKVKFSVDMGPMIQAGYFDSATNKVYVKGVFNNWGTSNELVNESGTIYSATVPVNQYGFYQYRYYTNSGTAPNNGNELDSDETTAGNRLLDLQNADLNLPVQPFNFSSAQPSSIDMAVIENKKNVFRFHPLPYGTPSFSTFAYVIKTLSTNEYNTQKPVDALPFDCGFIASDGTINVSEPVTTAQKAVFPDITRAALYYFCQSYLRFHYQSSAMPLWFRVGFGAYEAHLDPPDAAVKAAVNAYGNTFSSFSVLNDPTTFIANNGFAVAYAFGEFMSAFKNWGYPNVSKVSSSEIDVYPSFYNVDDMAGLLADFNRYVYARFLETNEQLRIRLYLENDHFRFYTRGIDGALNFPYFTNALEPALAEYIEHFKVTFYEKLTYFTLPTCVDNELEGRSCNGLPPERLTGGTAWSSGLHSTCASTADQLPAFYGMNRHELAHAVQGVLPQGMVTSWLNEGFAEFCSIGPITENKLNEIRQNGIEALKNGTIYFGHRPNYEETRIYPSPDYGYYTLGYILNDFIYRKGGYEAVKNVQLGDLSGFQKMGYSTAQAFLDDFYLDFDVRFQNKKLVTLTTPVQSIDEISNTVNIGWTPLSSAIKLNVAVSTDNGASWTSIATNTTATSCTWNTGTYIGKFLLKFSAPDVLNHQTTYGPFNKIDLEKPMINFPIGKEYLIAGDTATITWSNSNIANYKIEFSPDNGANWSTVHSSVPAVKKSYQWLIPGIASTNCKLRVSNSADATKSDQTQAGFNIIPANTVGGPYLTDKNTLLLLHFDNDLNNRSKLSGNGNGLLSDIKTDNTVSFQLGNCLNAQIPVTVSHHPNLNLNGDWTIEAWVKPTSFSSNTNMYILSKPGDTDAYASNYSLEINPWWGNVFHGFYFPASNTRIGISNFTPEINHWYHVAFIRDTKTSQIKILVHDINRNLVASQSAAYSGNETYLNSKDLMIGSGFNGFIDEVRISNVVRSFLPTNAVRLVGEKSFSIFPNPSNGIVNIHLKSDELHSDLRIYRIDGKLVLRKTITNTTDFTIDLSSESKGVYFIYLDTRERKQVEKLIIQ